VKAISSSANPRVRRWLQLAQQPRAARRLGLALAEGLHLARAALAADASFESLLLRRSTDSVALDSICAEATVRGAELFELSPVLFDRISPVEHGAGLISVLRLAGLERPLGATGDALYLDGVQDPGNVGTLLRTAAAAGLRDVLTSPDTAAVWAPKTLRAGQGAHFRLNIAEGVAPAELAARLSVFWIGADVRAAESLWQADLPAGRIGWIFGAEGRGLSPEARASCRRLVTIPIASGVESLNVAAAAAICLFERRRRVCATP
jgi:TrmH family RNA methyltransferase